MSAPHILESLEFELDDAMPFRITLLAVACLVSVSARAATRIELVIDEPSAGRAIAWPVTTGVPFPRGGLSDHRNCRLLDDLGHEHMLQSKVAATWDAARSSIRWLTIDFIAQPGRRYSLEFGPDVSRKTFPSKLVTAHPDGAIKRVDTGVLLAVFNRNKSNALQSIWLDADADGEFDRGERVVGDKGGEHFYLDQDRRRFSSQDTIDRKIVVETNGPVRACVRVDGYYGHPDFKGKQRIVAYRTRYHFFAGLGLIKVIDEFRIQGSTRGTQFRDIGFSLDISGASPRRRVAVDASGADGNQVKTIDWTDETAAISSYQSTYRHFGNLKSTGGIAELRRANDSQKSNERAVHTTEQIGEWIQLQTERFSVTGSLRSMWQQFPKEWEVRDNSLTLHLWSPRGGALDFSADGIRATFGEAGQKFLLNWSPGGTLNAISNFFYYAGHGALQRDEVDGQGINKHHEFWFHFATAENANVGAEYGRLAAKPPLALASGEWNCSTDVFGPLIPRGPKSQGGESATPPELGKYEAIVDRLFDLGRYAQDAFGDYGWWIFGSGPHYSYQWDPTLKRHYADPRRFEYHTYQKETQLWWNYLRSGERKFHDWAFPSEDHWVDIATTHVPLTYRCDWRGGFLKQQTLQFRPGDWSIDSALFYVRQRDSAEAWLRGCSQFQASYHRTLETTALAYYLSGDERYNDILTFWKDYWSDFAGKTSASNDWPTWLQEQPWYVASKPGEPAKSWAMMIRDYCPFTSGLRHQMTYFFSLSTLYEHTWDPVIGQVVRECADAYLDPKHRIGVWRTQENGLPAHADAPLLAHFWVPAMWKYARATQDPRMPGVFKKYFDACYAADPFREDIGRYSDVHIGYAYYYTRDAKHLRPALMALEKQRPNAEPLARPQDLGQRIYNPYTPIQCFTAVPRLMWALDTANRAGVAIPPPALLRPQRTAIALPLLPGAATTVTLWGYDKTLELFDSEGEPVRDLTIQTSEHASAIQPFDRIQPNFAVYLHELTLPESKSGQYVLVAPRLELAVLGIRHDATDSEAHSVFVNAARPISIEAGESFRMTLPKGHESLKLESALPAAITVFSVDGQPIAKKTLSNLATFDFDPAAKSRTVVIRNQSNREKLWIRVAEIPVEHCWGTFQDLSSTSFPNRISTRKVLRVTPPALAAAHRFVAGRFGQGLHIVAGREFRLVDHIKTGDQITQLVNQRQGTIEFYVKQLHDNRLAKTKPITFLTNGPLRAWCPRELPVGEWAHVAVEWRPLKRDPQRVGVHIYVNGLDRRSYRSTWWEGYSQKPFTMPAKSTWLREFVVATQPGAAFVIDELRISTIPRYARLDVELGGQQTFNPAQFSAPRTPFKLDKHTAALVHFDGDAQGVSALGPGVLKAHIKN